jgi:hypothetical protein
MHPQFYPISIVLLAVLVFLGQASAAPTPAWPSTKTHFHRQENGDPLSKPFTTQTVQTTQTEAGPVTETCTLTFTPVIGPHGESLVQVVRACTVSAGLPPPSNSNDTGSATPPSSTPPPSPNPVLSSIPLSSVTVSPPAPSPPPPPTGVPEPASSPVSTSSHKAQPSSPANTGTVPPDTAPDTTPTPDATSTPQGAFQIPGKKISVLPIGLGIFAGISVIALIVVGLVTYERTKYRKIFRQRKLAEQGSGPGYGFTGS